MKLIVDNQTFPCIDLIKKLKENKHVEIEQYENFQKMSFRNRYVIYGANGIASLTVPVVGGREQKTLITNVEIDNSIDWRIKHWRSLVSAYSRAPFFEFYAEDIKKMIWTEERFLFNFNFNILAMLLKLLKINVLIDFTSTYKHEYEEEIDCRNAFLPKSFQRGRENWQPKYRQVFEERFGFQPNLSILDLLFCEGPNAVNLI